MLGKSCPIFPLDLPDSDSTLYAITYMAPVIQCCSAFPKPNQLVAISISTLHRAFRMIVNPGMGIAVGFKKYVRFDQERNPDPNTIVHVSEVEGKDFAYATC